MPYETGYDSDQRIVPGMSDHSRSNASTPMRQNSEHDSIQTDRQNHPKSLVRMADSEYGGGEQNPSGSALCYGYKLPLKITPKYGLLADAGGHGETNPCYHLNTSMRQYGKHVIINRKVPNQTKQPK
jgi:hypothetical protein